MILVSNLGFACALTCLAQTVGPGQVAECLVNLVHFVVVAFLRLTWNSIIPLLKVSCCLTLFLADAGCAGLATASAGKEGTSAVHNSWALDSSWAGASCFQSLCKFENPGSGPAFSFGTQILGCRNEVLGPCRSLVPS